MKRTLILFGFKRSGKTSIGRRLAQKLRLPFIDTDEIIEDLYAEEHDLLSCAGIAKKEGEELFRQFERRAISSLEGTKEGIISVGGGAVLDPANCEILAKIGQLLYLQVDKETLKKRLLSGVLPSYLDPADPNGSFEKMYEKRRPIYEKISALRIDTEGKSEEEVAELLMQLMEQNDGQ